ncbi:putative WRKY transcription factor 30 [Vitis vinifera]|uniref:Putative WRKY transcription factor 30 n=1 Tax=Vitis vinifera TaxID=29760 RepID=A0A438JLW4_VITVI|nr:putative WRKY transcription factor 30 [Vitis vinifera]
MEMAREWEHNTLINELTQGREMANQLKNHLTPSSSRETREFLVEKILSSYEKALSMLKCGGFVSELPHSLPGSSPRSEGSNQDFKDQAGKDVFKKRKTLPRWTEQVRVTIGTVPEGPLDDGYSWRKYGQKDILGANFPRGYFRCTHRHAQGCSRVAPASVVLVDKEEPIEKKVSYEPEQQQQQPQEAEQIVSGFGTGLKVKTEDLDSREKIFPSFSFPLSDSETVDKIFAESMIENSLMGGFSPSFLSPATSESNYFPVSPCQMNSFGMGHSVYTTESDLTENISAPTSVTNSPIGDYSFPLDPVDFDPDFPFDNPEFFQ